MTDHVFVHKVNIAAPREMCSIKAAIYSVIVDSFMLFRDLVSSLLSPLALIAAIIFVFHFVLGHPISFFVLSFHWYNYFGRISFSIFSAALVILFLSYIFFPNNFFLLLPLFLLILTKSIAYGTKRFNAAFTRGLQ